MWIYGNEKYSIKVGKGDVYPIAYGGFYCWRCCGEEMGITPFDVRRSVLKELENNILLVFSGIVRENKETIEAFNRNYDIGEQKYIEAYKTLSECGLSFGKCLEKRKLDECGEIIEKN